MQVKAQSPTRSSVIHGGVLSVTLCLRVYFFPFSTHNKRRTNFKHNKTVVPETDTWAQLVFRRVPLRHIQFYLTSKAATDKYFNDPCFIYIYTKLLFAGVRPCWVTTNEIKIWFLCNIIIWFFFIKSRARLARWVVQIQPTSHQLVIIALIFFLI